ncbi:toll/interleukin-1 receptor domain-containing protein [Corallococcus interemptor]|uniref:Toll/interleukin-1 receptor domain-containing protein n=1 Tax=Corallococcus interemptor TaxID=2316720 RepID=A0A3A8QG04_9BACT|nr:toll/interleukin-1 receptor domain-containing protein [Corallococcus interemptor]RKH65215.1 toll/interleukin-1 receptor domain-containing protein [Corallococcus interemptor]
MSHYLPPLHLHIVSSKDFTEGAGYSLLLQQWFSGNERVFAVPEPNLPLYVWTDKEGVLPNDIPWAEARRTVLIVLVDDSLLAEPKWRAWVQRQANARRAQDLFLPVAFTENFKNGGPVLSQKNAVRLDLRPVEYRGEDLRLLVTHSLVRWFQTPPGDPAVPARLFISHAKAKMGTVSGRDIASRLKDFIDKNPAGTPFFDEVDIGGGEDFAETLAENVKRSVVIVLLTDAFSSRFWCGWEVAMSKELLRPVVVVNALEQGEVSSLSYMGKTPTIPWHTSVPGALEDTRMHRRIVATALVEQLRLAYDAQQLEAIRELAFPGQTDVIVAMRPPELATLPETRPGHAPFILLHSDPPLPRYELRLMARQRPEVMFASAAQALSGCYAGTQPLMGRRIAVSISDSPDRDTSGFSQNAQDRLWTRLATHLLAAGAELAYGGDPRVGGYMDQLFEFVRSITDAGQSLPVGIVHWYAGWPISANASTPMKAGLPSPIEPHWMPVPAEVANTADPSKPASDLTPEHRYAWTLGMSAMRREMAKDCHARILIGGQLRAVSPWPGLLEEFETFIGKPLYLMGAFGGTTQRLIDVLQGKPTPVEFTAAFQDEGSKRAPLREYYEQRKGPVDWDARVERIRKLGVAGLDNGLTQEENERLFVTRSLTEMISLVLKGLRNRFGPKP